MSHAHTPAFALQHTFLIPAHVSTLAYTQNGMLIMGSGELSRLLAKYTAQPRKTMGVFDSTPLLTLKSSEPFEVLALKSHLSLQSRRITADLVTYG